MEKINIVLVCGFGASTGFMAANIRKAAAEKETMCSVIAISEAEVEIMAYNADILMVGPHLKFQLDELLERVKNENIKVVLMKKSYFSLLDGKQALEHALEELSLVNK